MVNAKRGGFNLSYGEKRILKAKKFPNKWNEGISLGYEPGVTLLTRVVTNAGCIEKGEIRYSGISRDFTAGVP